MTCQTTTQESKWIHKFSRASILILIVLIGSANITNSFLLRWGFKDRQAPETYNQSFSLTGMMNGTAPRPFAYRSTAAESLKWCAEKIPEQTRNQLFKAIKKYDSLRNAYFPGIPESQWTPTVAITYHLMYLLVTACSMITLLTCWLLSQKHKLTWGQSLIMPIGFSFVYPLTFQQGGYYYDFIELTCAFGATYATIGKKWALCLAYVLIGSLNKETFFLVPASLMLLHDGETKKQKHLGILAAALAISLAGRYWIMNAHAQNPGEMAEHHFIENIQFWITPQNYLSFYNLTAKGIWTPSLQNPILSIPIILFLKRSWEICPKHVRLYTLGIWTPLIALYLAFGYKDEIRALSIGFPAIYLLALFGAPHFADTFNPRNTQTPHSPQAN